MTTYHNSNDGNYRVTYGIRSTPPTEANYWGDIADFYNAWGSYGLTRNDSVYIGYRDYVYVYFGQGTTIAGGNYGHGGTRITSLTLSN